MGQILDFKDQIYVYFLLGESNCNKILKNGFKNYMFFLDLHEYVNAGQGLSHLGLI